MRRAIWPEHRLVGHDEPDLIRDRSAFGRDRLEGELELFVAGLHRRRLAVRLGALRSSSRFSALVCFQSRQIETWECPALSPTVFARGGAQGALEHVATQLFHRGAVEVGAALTSMSLERRS